MSTDMLKMLSAADLSRMQPSSLANRVRDELTSKEGQALAGSSAVLPQQNDATDVERAVTQVNQFIQTLNRDLQFTVDEHSGRTIIKVLDSETKEVIRQIPPEELLQIANHLTEDGSLLLRARA